jgi:DNA replication protein DnaC
MNPELISTELKTVMRRLKLSKMLDTLGGRLVLARQQKMAHQDFLLLVLSDEASRREGLAAVLRAQRAHLEPEMQLERWDETAKVSYERELLNELVSLRFVEKGANVAIVGPVGVGKTFLAHALGHIACRRGYSVLALGHDQMRKKLRHARMDHTQEAEMRKLLSVDLLILDDFGLDTMEVSESREAYELFTERHRAGSMIVTSNRGPDEWLGTFADPVRAQSALDRFTSKSYDLVIEGESYRKRLKPRVVLYKRLKELE